MINNIKSIYLKKIVFSYVNESSKLKIMKYNNNLKNMMNINLINYRIFSRRYIIFENKEKGKEYTFNDKLIFAGEYLNGKRNGKGKEYDENGNLKFEGNYINGKKSGKGKEFNKEGDLIFEGDYLNGKRNGKGKEYYINYFSKERILKYDGDYLNGERNGRGKEYNEDGEIEYEGEFLYGKRRKDKNIIYKTSHEVEHNIFLEEIEKEITIYPEYEFESEYLNEERTGKTKEYHEGSLIFEGEYLKGKRNGKGKEYYFGDLIFEGEYLNGKRWNGKIYNLKKK